MPSFRVLVVEDELTIALLIEDMLESLGHVVVAKAMRVSPGLNLARSINIDVAILDVNLNGELSFDIADVLSARRVPFFFVTGYGSPGLRQPYLDAVVIRKPFGSDDLAAALDSTMPS